MMKPDFNNMSNQALKAYVSAHRDDDDALAVLIRRLERSIPHRSPDETEEAFQALLDQKLKHDVA